MGAATKIQWCAMSDLHLHVKTEYFEAIKRGEKTEEYRLYNDCWRKKLLLRDMAFGGIVIHNAYKPGEGNRLRFPWSGCELKTITHPHFGPTPVSVFAIKLEGEASQ